MKKLIGVVIVVVAFAVLLTASLKTTSNRMVPVSELRLADSSYVGQRLRVAGFVGDEPVRSETESSPSGTIKVHHFTVEDKDKSMRVEFRDALPDTFKSGGTVQVDGLYSAPGYFKADHVYTKCPSKYEAETKARMRKPEAVKSKPDQAYPAR